MKKHGTISDHESIETILSENNQQHHLKKFNHFYNFSSQLTEGIIFLRSSSDLSCLCSSCSLHLCPHCPTLPLSSGKEATSKTYPKKSLLYLKERSLSVCLFTCFPTDIKMTTLKFCGSCYKH